MSIPVVPEPSALFVLLCGWTQFVSLLPGY